MFWNEENHGWNREILHKTIYVHLHKRNPSPSPGLLMLELYSRFCYNLHKIFEKNSSFHVKLRTTGKVQFLFLKRLLLVLTKFSFREEDWALGNNSIKFWDFPDICLFPNILSFFLWALWAAQRRKCREQVV